MGLAKCGSYAHLQGGWNVASALWNCLDWKQVRSSQRKDEVLDFGMRTDAGLGKAADSTPLTAHCTAVGSEGQGRKGLI